MFLTFSKTNFLIQVACELSPAKFNAYNYFGQDIQGIKWRKGLLSLDKIKIKLYRTCSLVLYLESDSCQACELGNPLGFIGLYF